MLLKKIENKNLEDFMLIAKWYNDPEILPYIKPRMSDEPLTMTDGVKMYERDKDNLSKERFFITVEGKPIGVVSIDKAFEDLISEKKSTAWISICIGEKEYWGKGLSKTAMKLLEEECKSQGFKGIELGVFEFNERAIGLYKGMGYEEIGFVPDFTLYNAKWYKDIRMYKSI